MKVVCAYTSLRPETYRVVRKWPDHEFVDVSGSDTAYAELLCRLWAEGEGWVNVEHDVVPLVGQIGALIACRHPYCAAPVALGPYSAPCLSLAKFSAQFLADFPDVMDRVMRVPSNYGPPGHWKQLDCALQQTVLVRRYGQQPHIHLPAAKHLNPVKSILVPGAPLRTWVDARFATPEPPDG